MVTAFPLFLALPALRGTHWHMQNLFLWNFHCHFVASGGLGSADKALEKYLEV